MKKQFEIRSGNVFLSFEKKNGHIIMISNDQKIKMISEISHLSLNNLFKWINENE